MGAFEGHKIYGIKIRESADDGSDFSNPDADYRLVFLGEDGQWHAKDSAGAVTALGGDVSAHTGETTDAHDASAISFTPAGTIAATDVQAAIEEVASEAGGSSIPNLYVGSMPPFNANTVSFAPSANRAYLVKFIPTANVTVGTAFWNCSTSSGNLDFGIYNADFSSRLGSTGSFASPGTGARSQALTGSVALTAGTVYYVAAAFSSAAFRGPMAIMGSAVSTGGANFYGREESAFPLPSSIASVDAWEDGVTVPAFYFGT
jgi:hypothetical protein